MIPLSLTFKCFGIFSLTHFAKGRSILGLRTRRRSRRQRLLKELVRQQVTDLCVCVLEVDDSSLPELKLHCAFTTTPLPPLPPPIFSNLISFLLHPSFSFSSHLFSHPRVYVLLFYFPSSFFCHLPSSNTLSTTPRQLLCIEPHLCSLHHGLQPDEHPSARQQGQRAPWRRGWGLLRQPHGHHL